jgi:hypothetical protein
MPSAGSVPCCVSAAFLLKGYRMKIRIENSWDEINKRPLVKSFSDMNEAGIKEVIEAYLHEQMGRGEDHRTPNKVDKYIIEISLDTSEDKITVESNTGNSALTCGIVMAFWERLL